MNTKRRNFRLASGEVGFQKGFLRPALGPQGENNERTRKSVSALFSLHRARGHYDIGAASIFILVVWGACIMFSFAMAGNAMVSR